MRRERELERVRFLTASNLFFHSILYALVYMLTTCPVGIAYIKQWCKAPSSYRYVL